MITVDLNGGLGNQCFQMACAYAEAKKRGTDLRFCISNFMYNPKRLYSLGLWKGITQTVCLDLPEPLVKEKHFHYDPKAFDIKTNDFSMSGYWQSEKYFSDLEVQKELKEIFLPGKKLTDHASMVSERIQEAGNKSVFLNIRRTDYLLAPEYHRGMLPAEYYKQGLDLISKGEPLQVFIFTDDPEWVLNNFRVPTPHKAMIAGTFDRTNSDHLGREDEDLWLMSQCYHGIMANSTYSWFGAWLSPHEHKKDRVVVCPEPWFGPAADHDTKDLIPKRWTKLGS
jgi:hypothetical protein